MSGAVAPHEGNEVRLVASGYKPLATIEKKKQPLLYSMATALASTGMLVAVFIKSSDSPEGEVIITAPRNRHLIPQYIKLQATGVKEFGIKEYHRRMGRLYGYSEADIQAFIESEVHCDCTKCSGNGRVQASNNSP